MRQRQIFDTLQEMMNFIKQNPAMTAKKVPYRVIINGEVKYALAGNSDQAIAAVSRHRGVTVEVVGMGEMLVNV